MMHAIRRANAADAGPLSVCIRAAYAPFATLELPDVAGGIAEDIAAHLVWVHEVNGTLSGGIIVSWDGVKAHLVNLAVAPAFAGQGIGSSLIRNALDYLRAQGATSVDLATHAGMPQNIDLYVHLGWHETERAEDKVFMTRRLSGTEETSNDA